MQCNVIHVHSTPSPFPFDSTHLIGAEKQSTAFHCGPMASSSFHPKTWWLRWNLILPVRVLGRMHPADAEKRSRSAEFSKDGRMSIFWMLFGGPGAMAFLRERGQGKPRRAEEQRCDKSATCNAD